METTDILEEEMTTHLDPNLESRSFRHAYPAGVWLIATIPIMLLIFVPLRERASLFISLRFPIVVLVHLVTGFFWARAITRMTGWPSNIWVNLAAGIGYILSFTVAFYLWGGLVETVWGYFNLKDETFFQFVIYFTFTAGIITGGTGLALGLGLKAPKLAFQLFRSGLLAGAGVFLATALLMASAGFRVGTPRPDDLPSMVIVTFLGIWLTALIGSEMFGRILARYRPV